MDRFHVGEEVRHKSGGGHVMIVKEPERNGIVECEWMDGNTAHTGKFKAEMLERIPELPEPEDYPDS